jgi:hypothetical protein
MEAGAEELRRRIAMGKVNLAKREHQIGQRSRSGCIYKGFGELVVHLTEVRPNLNFSFAFIPPLNRPDASSHVY